MAIKRIQSSILGLVLLLTSWLILNTINPQLVRLEPLPQLWDIGIFPGFDLSLDKMQAPPCSFVVVFPEVRFRGTPKKPIRFDKKEDVVDEIDPIIAHIHGVDVVAPDPDKNEVQKIIGRGALNQYSNPWSSAKGFIRLTVEEEKMLKERTISIERYNDQGVKDPNGLFKEGGLCMIDLFHTTSRWLSVNLCGGRLARVQLPSRDLSESKFRDEPITCVEVIRSIPQQVETVSPILTP